MVGQSVKHRYVSSKANTLKDNKDSMTQKSYMPINLKINNLKILIHYFADITSLIKICNGVISALSFNSTLTVKAMFRSLAEVAQTELDYGCCYTGKKLLFSQKVAQVFILFT